MFRKIARRSAITVAVATFAVSALVSSTALAAPADSLVTGGQSEAFAQKSTIKIPVADASVQFENAWDGSYPNLRTHAYRVRNLGPAPATITIKKSLYRYDCQPYNAPSCNHGLDVSQQTIDLASGASYLATVTCAYQHCSSTVEVKAERAIDPNTDNNSASRVD